MRALTVAAAVLLAAACPAADRVFLKNGGEVAGTLLKDGRENVVVDLGFGVEVDQTLRLRGIDAPELSERAGVRAREFVRQALEGCERVAIVAQRRDKYGRWLADLYYHPGWRDGRRLLSRGTWLNQQLVSEGLAGRYGK